MSPTIIPWETHLNRKPGLFFCMHIHLYIPVNILKYKQTFSLKHSDQTMSLLRNCMSFTYDSLCPHESKNLLLTWVFPVSQFTTPLVSFRCPENLFLGEKQKCVLFVCVYSKMMKHWCNSWRRKQRGLEDSSQNWQCWECGNRHELSLF